ncbi:MAG: hypothetical protein M1826_002221 [Phylliscum demangeonii]|nr:MAG: hypothetical protein M1826_002221 [Phylliscum demangeonii]
MAPPRTEPSHRTFPPIRACLFDMDGLLIDSEDIYTICTNQILAEHHKPALPWHIKAQLQGRPAPEASAIFQRWAQLPISSADFAAQIAVLQRHYFPTCRPLPGVEALLHTLRSNGGQSAVHLALATSSHGANYALKTAHLAPLFAAFPAECVVRGDDGRIPAGRGKPAPDIYLLALQTVNARVRRMRGEQEPLIKPEECLVFEDSVPGVQAGRRAGMRVVWVPHPLLLKEFAGREHDVLAGAGIAGLDAREGPGQGVAIGAAETLPDAEQTHLPSFSGQSDDGWAELLPSLERFPYHRYGIDVPEDTQASGRR